MAAIWGIIQPSSSTVDPSVDPAMRKRMSKYVIDRFDSVVDRNVYFACGHQYFTREAEREVLPVYDAERDLFFTADCVLDNREELMEELGIEDPATPDGRIAYQAYLRWGEKFVEKLLGVFAFAIYERSQDLFLLYTDHTGRRCIHYSRLNGVIYFSTTYDLFPELLPNQLHLSEKWLSGWAASALPLVNFFEGVTPYEEVRQLSIGHYMKVCNQSLEDHRYWDPQDIKPLKLHTEEEYKSIFLDTYTRCVRQRLREGVQIGSMLSAGLDSSSVVSLAAPILHKQGRRLQTYTSIPDNDEDTGDSRSRITNEGIVVRKTASCFPNIDDYYIDCKGQSAFSHMESTISRYMLPVKSLINFTWVNEINAAARANGCRILLGGWNGNTTVSQGSFFAYEYQLLTSGHLIKAVKTFHDFCHYHKASRKRIFRFAADGIAVHLKSTYKEHTFDLPESSAARRDLMQKYKIVHELHMDYIKYSGGWVYDQSQRKNAACNVVGAMQGGYYDTMTSLLYGVIQRDPTFDKRIIELCISLPEECYFNHSIERYLIRGFMKDLIPEHIIKDYYRRGKQSADFMIRLNRDWVKSRDLMVSLLEYEDLHRILDEERLEKYRNQCMTATCLTRDDTEFCFYLLDYLSISLYLKEFFRPNHSIDID